MMCLGSNYILYRNGKECGEAGLIEVDRVVLSISTSAGIPKTRIMFYKEFDWCKKYSVTYKRENR